jgi:hypothetical protein
MKKRSAFDEGKARTPKSEAHQREIKIERAMGEFVEIADEDEFKRRLAERFDILPGHPRYEKVMSIWRELQRGRF